MVNKIVYDFGANNGDNIPYYLLKFDKVVAVEANQELAKQIIQRFSNYVISGRVIVENCIVSDSPGLLNFYLHKTKNILSQLPKPKDIKNFTEVKIKAKTPSSIIKEYGDPEYIKIDVEHTDSKILKDLFTNNIFPKYISVESHDILVFSLLVSSEKYSSYKILDGQSIHDIYKNKNINGEIYTFPFHSAGPMFEDIETAELNKEELFYELAKQRLGWKDIHAKRFI
jgi:FkbM family methyltransferase